MAADLTAHLLRAGFAVAEAGVATIEVSRRDAPNPDQERREVELQVSVWRATHPDAEVEILD